MLNCRMLNLAGIEIMEEARRMAEVHLFFTRYLFALLVLNMYN